MTTPTRPQSIPLHPTKPIATGSRSYLAYGSPHLKNNISLSHIPSSSHLLSPSHQTSSQTITSPSMISHVDIDVNDDMVSPRTTTTDTSGPTWTSLTSHNKTSSQTTTTTTDILSPSPIISRRPSHEFLFPPTEQQNFTAVTTPNKCFKYRRHVIICLIIFISIAIVGSVVGVVTTMIISKPHHNNNMNDINKITTNVMDDKLNGLNGTGTETGTGMGTDLPSDGPTSEVTTSPTTTTTSTTTVTTTTSPTVTSTTTTPPVTTTAPTAVQATSAPTTQTPTTAPTAASTPKPVYTVDQSNQIYYYNGTVMSRPITIYLIFYGTWPSTHPALRVLPQFIQDLSSTENGTRWWSMATTYYSFNYTTGVKTYPSSQLTYGGSLVVPTYDPFATSLTKSNVYEIARNAAESAQMPGGSGVNEDAIYVVVPSAEIVQGGITGFCHAYCGFHNQYQARTGNMKKLTYAFVGDGETQCKTCFSPPLMTKNVPTVSKAPNGDVTVDSMVSVLAHEILEAATAPLVAETPSLIATWGRGGPGMENADICAGTYGYVYNTPSGAATNIKMGDNYYLVQQIWVNNLGGYCGLRDLVKYPNPN